MGMFSTLKPVPVDSNGRRLVDRGSVIGCDLRSLDTNWLEISFPVDIKGLIIDIVSGTVYLDGTLQGSKAWVAHGDVVDVGAGKISVESPGHGFVSGQTVTFVNAGYITGNRVLTSGTDADTLEWTQTYAALHIEANAAYVLGHRYPSYTGPVVLPPIPVAVEPDTVICSMKASTTAVVGFTFWR